MERGADTGADTGASAVASAVVAPSTTGWAAPAPSYRMIRVPKVREAIKRIEADGWREVATKGSHRQFKHPTKNGRVTIAGHPSDDLAPGTYNSILKQAGLKE